MDTAAFMAVMVFDPAGKARPELERALERYAELEAWAAAGRLACMAAIEGLGDDGVRAEAVARATTHCSKKAAKRAAKTARQLARMPHTRSALERGEITPEHADAAADAAVRVSPEAVDADLVRDAQVLPADRFAKASRSYANARERLADQHDRHERQRRARTASVWTSGEGMVCVHAELDPVTGQAIKTAFAAEIDRLWRDDGGRDGSAADVRTSDQRGADAFANLITRPAGTASAAKRPHPKHTVMLRVDADRCRIDSPDGTAELTDGTPLAQAVLERIACDAEFVGAIYDSNGAVLWQGRRTRLATDDQWTALIDRDGGCFCCDADPAHCQAHHLTAWNLGGPTDIDAMVLVCTTTHHLIHDHGYEVIRRDGQWVLRTPSGGRAPPGSVAA